MSDLNSYDIVSRNDISDFEIYTSVKGRNQLICDKLEFDALKEDYNKLLIQVQAEMMQKEHYKSKLASANGLLMIANDKINRASDEVERLNRAFKVVNENYKYLLREL